MHHHQDGDSSERIEREEALPPGRAVTFPGKRAIPR